MEEFKKKGINIQMSTTEELSEEYLKMIKIHKKYLYDKIINTIHHHIRGISSTEIESLIDRYLFIDIEFRGKETIETLKEGLQTAFTETIDTMNGEDKDQLLKKYLEKINLPLRRNKMDWLYEITNEFSKELNKKIELYFALFRGISDNNFTRTIDNLNKEIEQIMKEYQNKFNQDYEAILEKFKENNKKQINDLMNVIDLSNKKSSNFQIYSAIMELSNYELIEENGILYAKDKITAEKIELTFNGDILSSKDSNLKYRVDNKNKRIGYFNNKTKIAILAHNGLITLITPKSKEQEENIISFKKIGHSYQLYHNLKLINDIEKIKSMIEQIEKYAPGIYDKLISDKDFEKLLVQINNHTTGQEKAEQKKESTDMLTESNNNEDLSPNGRKPK